ncbi:hypothetical protein [Cognatilysobacter tabacisoli]|uniref:hypothetical protein n=1 Tax=Cognatilysobacter tabacisoli TaxID=2315424 RepID=UPI0018C8B8BC|nr:hypothetical protein [Lysobacter tabacisoli]
MATHPTPELRRGANRWRPLIWGGAAGLLLLPLVAMQFTAEVNWTGGDFIAMGALLAIACSLYELGAWLSGNPAYRAGFAIAVLAGFLTVWVNLAVGMFGSEHNDLNLMFAGVLLVAALGALAARFRAAGMARAMAATGVAQLVAAGVGLAVGLNVGTDEVAGPSLYREAFLTACFAVPWFASAWLFERAASRAVDGAAP